MSRFTVQLSGLKLSAKDTKELESQLRETTIKFLNKSKKGKRYLDNAIELDQKVARNIVDKLEIIEPNSKILRWLRFPYPGFLPLPGDADYPFGPVRDGGRRIQ